MVTEPIESTRPIDSSVVLLRNKYVNIKLYTIKGCKNCQLMKEHLDQRGVEYQLVDCDKNMDEAVAVLKAAGSDILPVLCYNGDNYIVGYDKDNVDKLVQLCKR